MKKRATLAPAAGLVLALAFPTEGCRQIVGIGDDPRYDGPPQACAGMTYASADCASCMTASCCAEAESCAAAASCGDFAGCASACAPADTACASACRTRFAAGDVAEAGALASCEAARCASACQTACGGYVYADASCAACGNAHCCDAATTCMGDSECAALTACERACTAGDDGCLELCEFAHPNGVAHERAFGACLNASCPSVCISTAWACLEHPVTPPPLASGPPISITYLVTGYESGQPISGLGIQACARTNLPCMGTPLATGQTDDSGTATLHFAANSFNGFAQITGAGYPTVRLYLPPLAKDFVAPSFPLPTLDDLKTLTSNAGAPLDSARGSLFVRVADCAGSPAGGVEFAIEPTDAMTTEVYFAAGSPSKPATMTDGTAYGGFLNVEPDTAITVHATVAANGLAYPPAPPVQARAGTDVYTLLYLYATPP